MTDTTDGFENRRARFAAARAGRFLRHAAGRRADVPDDRSRPRSGTARQTAQQEAARWFAKSLPDAAGVNKLLANWEQRFKLIEVG